MALTTSGTYTDNIILFMLWLFDTGRGFLVQEYIPEFVAMNHEDLLDFKRCEEDVNVTNRRKRNLINDRTGIRKLTRQLVDAIQILRSGISHNSPIKLNGEGDITYKLVQDYMEWKMNVAYVYKDISEKHFPQTWWTVMER